MKDEQQENLQQEYSIYYTLLPFNEECECGYAQKHGKRCFSCDMKEGLEP